ncbi:hypothetical protein [Peribacillus frigoritolerans]|uniref:Uncharacterized protein n=1 Tax=Peribacillus castrilensis TaxID=2897690 RepID=A0AAW9N990_9BACI|nr:hypothetical protein [Peribacillus castrilensis]
MLQGTSYKLTKLNNLVGLKISFYNEYFIANDKAFGLSLRQQMLFVFFRNLIKHNIKSLESVKNQLKAVYTDGSHLDDIIEIIEDLKKKGETKWIKLKLRKTLEVP